MLRRPTQRTLHMDEAAFKPAPGTLYVVATPIGNLRDIPLRALDVLRAADCVAAEDTRVTEILLRHYGIGSKLLPLHEHNERAQSARVAALLSEGKSVALVSDAGTPAISDPGTVLVGAVRAAGHSVVTVPGPSALAAALSLCGWLAGPFRFEGFLPSKPAARRNALEALAAEQAALVFYEAPHRIAECVADLAASLGGARRITIARELTKRFESVHECALADAPAWLAGDPDRLRGEFVLIVEGAPAQDVKDLGPEDARILRALLAELPASRAARVAAELTGKPRAAFYEAALAQKE